MDTVLQNEPSSRAERNTSPRGRSNPQGAVQHRSHMGGQRVGNIFERVNEARGVRSESESFLWAMLVVPGSVEVP